MKYKIVILSFLIATLHVFNCDAIAVEATATATILPVISGTKNTETPTGGDLVFGIIIPSESSGTVTITPLTSSRSYSGGVQLVSSVYGAASFNVTGAANSAYTVILPDNGAITISAGSSTMVVNSFTVSPASNTLKLNSEGLSAFNIGGKLEVSANQPPGNYTGTFKVNIAYQ